MMTGFLRAGGIAAALTASSFLFSGQALAANGSPAPATAQAISLTSLPTPAIAAPAQPAVSQAAPAVGTGFAPTIAAPVVPVAPVVRPRPLSDLVISFVDYGNQDAEQMCLATAVYFEARGETLEGQLAVAEVVLNRAASGIYPSTLCGVVTQPAQFSFVRHGKFPRVNLQSDAWHTALAISDIARKRLAQQVAPSVLWYHASYVSPAWGRNLTRFGKIGMHIFYS